MGIIKKTALAVIAAGLALWLAGCVSVGIGLGGAQTQGCETEQVQGIYGR